MNNINQKIISDVFNINNKNINNNAEVVVAAIQPQILAIDPSYVLAVSVDSITGDNVINIVEASQEVVLTGTVAGNYGELISVTVTINDNEYEAKLDSNNAYSVAVSGSDLVADNSVSVAAFAVDSTENTYNGEIEHSYDVQLEPRAAPNVVITEDIDDDGVIENSELQDTVDYVVTVDADATVGNTLQITTTYTENGVVTDNVIEIMVTEEIIANGYTGSFTDVTGPTDGSEIIVDTIIIDQYENASTTSTDSAVLNLTEIDPCEDPGIDADPVFLWHLGANLTATEGPSDQRGKTGGKYGDDINYATSDLNDAIYIGYSGLDNDDNLVKSPWDGDFERDHGDGNALWSLETYGGHDLVHIREDQNAYTSAKLGSGNDTYYVQGEMDAVLSLAQTNLEARSYIYTEECNDTVVIGGNGEGKVTGWGIDGGRIFMGRGNDEVTVYGEMDDGGVIDLGAGRVEFALDEQAAASVDSAEHTNYLTITHNLGNAGANDFGHVFGGDANDNVSIGTFVEGTSEVNLGEGTNNIDIGDDLDGQSKIITGSGVDTLVIGDDTEDSSSIDLGDGNNSITIASYVEDHSTIKVGNGNDVIEVAKSMVNHSEIHLGEGDNSLSFGKNILGATHITASAGVDTLVVGHKIDGRADIDLGAGNNIITTGDDVDGHSRLTTHEGSDTLTVGEDVEDYAVIDLGDGDNIINVARHIEDHSTIITGDGEDTLAVEGSTLNHASVNLGGGSDVMSVVNSVKGDSSIDLGMGDDIITVCGSDLSGLIAGGSGTDTLILDYSLDSRLVDGNRHITNATTENLTGIERVELNGQNVLDVRFEDILQDTDRESALFINGNDLSKVDLGSTNWSSDDTSKAKMDDVTGGDWSLVNSEVIAGVSYDVYQHSNAVSALNDVYIEQGVMVI
ncbi:Ig-like domain-containing protein [Psychrobacter sp. UBA3962]|uniref:Ig-like domain-containing protein n=1 Tax=Psychrobacter sp. UBA3962 TaxID=1947352 RepID=UPI0025D37634|nr:Ig-like domain-containing protein [Psychrobacter sp. UBA3962]